MEVRRPEISLQHVADKGNPYDVSREKQGLGKPRDGGHIAEPVQTDGHDGPGNDDSGSARKMYQEALFSR